MRQHHSFVLLALVALTAPPAYAQSPGALPTATIAARATPASVTILTFDASGDTLGQGSGFVIRSSGVIVTNWHVLAGASSATVMLASGERYDRVLFLDGDSARDVVLVQIPGSGLPAVPTRDDVPPTGSRVVVIGSPLGLPRTVSEGIVSATRMVEGQELVQVSAPISHGSSGGPVLDDNGRVFAIAAAMLSEGQQLNFAVPVRYATGLLGLHSSPQPLASAPTSRSGTSSSSLSAASSSNSWTPPRTSAPKSTLTGSYLLARGTSDTRAGEAKPEWFTGTDILVLLEDGSGLMGVNCDSGGLCGSAYYLTGTTAPSGDIVLDPHSGYAFDGYQTEDGFAAYAKWTEAEANLEVWLRGWVGSLPLSKRSGLYACNTRTQWLTNSYEGDFTDWWGTGAVMQTADSVYLDLSLTNRSGGTTGAYFVAPLSGARLDARTAYKGDPKRLSATLSAGSLIGKWVDYRDKGSRFEGTLTCKRQ